MCERCLYLLFHLLSTRRTPVLDHVNYVVVLASGVNKLPTVSVSFHLTKTCILDDSYVHNTYIRVFCIAHINSIESLWRVSSRN